MLWLVLRIRFAIHIFMSTVSFPGTFWILVSDSRQLNCVQIVIWVWIIGYIQSGRDYRQKRDLFILISKSGAITYSTKYAAQMNLSEESMCLMKPMKEIYQLIHCGRCFTSDNIVTFCSKSILGHFSYFWDTEDVLWCKAFGMKETSRIVSTMWGLARFWS